jgi:hypothetical protein
VRPREGAWNSEGNRSWKEEQVKGGELVGQRNEHNEKSSREGEEISPWKSLESHQSHTSVVPGGGHL